MISSEVSCAVQLLSAEYWRRVDRLSQAPVSELYAASGVMQISTMRCEGQAQIERFFAERTLSEEQAQRTTRHITGGLAIEALSASRYRVYSTVLVLSGNGERPLPSQVPSSVADFVDVVVSTPEGVWLYESRTAQAVFTGTGAPSFAR
ncbi:hypothetical protein ATI02_0901 [Pseudomonas baetica]|uniref:SnoaL-like domain-containing protein n=1 Tax=Pseudomonas baetica TaxID=674054 RepID=A0ABX4PVD7_9PSED|nr:nuclear transport factor 2 family protein [Pseudomonas baetica]PKA68156.1 hypothetical protein ATI02_0901 [Pseudomonas baetica]PTC17971.1 hypothetical protein C0J26_18165 [Pseudomonas baetica]